MFQTIQEKLLQIEQQEQVKIIYAAESGSRAWGFASPDSDYDVRFIYVRKPEFYYKLEKTRDVIEWQLDETLDINGWDLQKALRLLHNSNPTLFEWSNSSIVYRTSQQWKEVQSIMNSYLSFRAMGHHYYNMAANDYRLLSENELVRLKRYFYVLRPILACHWILEEQTAPPMLFEALVREKLNDDTLKTIVYELLHQKMYAPESQDIPRIEAIHHYVEQQLYELKVKLDALQKEQKKGYEQLNSLFLQIVKNA